MFSKILYLYLTFAPLLLGQQLLATNEEYVNYIEDNDFVPELNLNIEQINIFLKNLNNSHVIAKFKSALKRENEEEHVAIINEWADEVIQNLNKFVIQKGLEPIGIEGLESSFKWTIFSGWVIFDQGTLDGLSSLNRKADVVVTYKYPNLKTTVSLGFTSLHCNYKYEIKFMHLGPRGRAVVKTSGSQFAVDLSMDMITLQATLNKFKVITLGKLSIKLKGNVLTDWLVNTVIFTVKPILRLIISGVVESYIIEGITYIFNYYNSIVCMVLTCQ